MSEPSNVTKTIRDRLGQNTEDRLGKALSELLENPLLTGAIGRAFDAREKASQAQEVALGALNIPSAADVERLTRRLRSVSHRLEGIEDGLDRLDRALAPSGVEARLSSIESQLNVLTAKFEHLLDSSARDAAVTGAASTGVREAAKAERPAAKAERPAAKAGRAPAKARRATAKPGRAPAKASRASAKVKRASAKAQPPR